MGPRCESQLDQMPAQHKRLGSLAVDSQGLGAFEKPRPGSKGLVTVPAAAPAQVVGTGHANQTVDSVHPLSQTPDGGIAGPRVVQVSRATVMKHERNHLLDQVRLVGEPLEEGPCGRLASLLVATGT